MRSFRCSYIWLVEQLNSHDTEKRRIRQQREHRPKRKVHVWLCEGRQGLLVSVFVL